MFISPRAAIENGWITHPECKTYNDFVERKFVSPNAIDFTVDKMYALTNSVFVVSEEDKQMRKSNILNPITHSDGNQYFKLSPGSVYDALSDFYIEVPENVACSFIIRSTFNRNGLFVTSGLYDSGFKGNLGFAIHNRAGTSLVAPGTRIAQIIFHKSDSIGVYEGGYNHEKGTHWSESKNMKEEKPTKKTTSKKSSAKVPPLEDVAKTIEKEVNSVTEADEQPFGKDDAPKA